MHTRRTTQSLFILFLCLAGLGSDLRAQTDLSEPREVWATGRQSPDRVMDAVGVRPGMTIGEIGAGRGRYTVYLARRVGPAGKILANDIDPQSLAYLRDRCARLGFQQVQTVLGKVDDPLLPKNSLDLAVMVWVYHMLDKPDELLAKLRPCLKPGARLVILDPCDREIDEEFHIDRSRPGVRTPTLRERVEASARAAGFELIRVETFLPEDVIFILGVREN